MTHTVKSREHVVLTRDDSPLMRYTAQDWVRAANQRINTALHLRAKPSADPRAQDEIIRAWSPVRAIQERRLAA